MPKTVARNQASPPDDPIQEIVLPRESGTHGDVLAAIGLAALLEDAARDRRVQVTSRGSSFAVSLSRPRRPSALVATRPAPGYQYLQSRSNVPLPDKLLADDAVDYQKVRDTIKELRERETELHRQIASTTDEGQRTLLRQQVDLLRQEEWPIPPSIWRRYPPYLVLQGHETANKLLTELVRMPEDDLREQVRRALVALAAGQPSGVDVKAWKVNTVQVFMPNAAKGYARLKPDSTGRGDKTKDAWADPFLEWLRYRGYFVATVPVFHGSKGEHIRILAPIPGDIPLAAYRSIVQQLPTPRGGSPAKIDILATLDLARLLIRRSELFQTATVEDPDELVSLTGKAPGEVISGIAITNYQSLGSARAVSAVSELAVPGWFRVKHLTDATLWLEILDEHFAIVRALDDSHSDELTLLLGYRRFLEQRGSASLEAFLNFTGAYGNHVFRVREQDNRRRIRQFHTRSLRRVVIEMEPKYKSILDDEGFQAVAAAVRRATVAAQSLKANRKDHRDIRYGLLPDIRRARELPGNEPLMVAVSEFVALYNAENARRQESKNPPWHARVTTAEFSAFAQLVDDHNASIVGALLCAYGTCTERREGGQGESGMVTNDSEPTDSDELVAGDPDESAEDQDG